MIKFLALVIICGMYGLFVEHVGYGVKTWQFYLFLFFEIAFLAIGSIE